MKNTIFTGAAVAIVTPMHADGTVDLDKLGRFIDFQIQGGTDAIVICATTGESSTLTHEEHIEAIRYAVQKTAGRVPVIAGTGSNDTAYAVKLSLEAQKAGVDALLCVTPYYNKTSQAGLVAHFTYIADRVDLPIILYNVPSRTGVNIKPETYLTLSKHPNIVATKEANGDITSVARTAALCGDDLAIYSGNDDQIVPLLSLGAKGVISVLSNVMPQKAHDICARYFAGDVEGSRRLQLELISLIDALFITVNPIPVKAALNLMGFDMGPCRLPLTDLSEQEESILKAELEKHHLLQKVFS
ncbi:4-hydroxy-tetrahydrodipicolinate synthase [Ethanoligenens harbinense]|uniref:4-hydroxy-tetrahydrodipicolinate synthase n=1 Tax=Ethanoligenens harbinense (strain DSM 18485 / JCM 12961 / CGMCC 1.5033 / YUAN-3) TaxID=663278 RepID=E6U6Z5_ETHHY|nr:4-hydroxy-tetrahydrodipicolinate synthase [Ethanoligenens harbinense]ADU26962.1 dihydrodipicolinate synthase [Ethanoligenens harbinense YUAN-3]AVQ96052.1 4-hydroxy-tetrahydrodipicolinate synthase [Ethanoligenens harbinense YUAN-3]AYF38713.1 4-hydroxy-tetrahydrodipicolinate synthase [Ethanoligenens harbinense]AYF41460.1 4-hydroxy-tetrahydrodipicolinate synthase [Ethanoligenens harbinense]QCN92294.1 4-hydroxy-tetrahydrodipicolinate synthase [Ethanoligenens harbinense]